MLRDALAGLPLTRATAPGWAATAVQDLDALLVDHAHWEHKAASTALRLINRFPDHQPIIRPLLALAAENGVRVLLLEMRVTPLEQDPRTTAFEYRTAIAEHNQILRRLAERFGASFVAMEELTSDQLLGITWSATGNRWRAERVAEVLGGSCGRQPLKP